MNFLRNASLILFFAFLPQVAQAHWSARVSRHPKIQWVEVTRNVITVYFEGVLPTYNLPNYIAMNSDDEDHALISHGVHMNHRHMTYNNLYLDTVAPDFLDQVLLGLNIDDEERTQIVTNYTNYFPSRPATDRPLQAGAGLAARQKEEIARARAFAARLFNHLIANRLRLTDYEEDIALFRRYLKHSALSRRKNASP